MLGGDGLTVGVLLDDVEVVSGACAFVRGGRRSPIRTRRSCVAKAWRSLTDLRRLAHSPFGLYHP